MNNWIRWLDRPARLVDTLLLWLLAAMVALMFGLVAARYAFSFGSIAGQELVLWLHSLVFLLGCAGTLRAGKHVRVDVFYQGWSPRTQALVDLAGYLILLLPFAIFMLSISVDYVAASWALREGSREPGGLPAVYLLKALIPLTASMLIMQTLAEALRCVQRWQEAAR